MVFKTSATVESPSIFADSHVSAIAKKSRLLLIIRSQIAADFLLMDWLRVGDNLHKNSHKKLVNKGTFTN